MKRTRFNVLRAPTFKQYIAEALRASEKSQVDSWKKGRNDFSNRFFGGPDKDKETHQRRYFDFKANDDSPVKKEIESHFEPHGITIANYRTGLAKNRNGRDVRIGKALIQTKADPNLLKKYNEDPVRSNKESDNLKILISRHPHDVAGMTSCGHPWEDQSCMNFNTGSHRDKLKNDVLFGTHVAYLVKTDDEGHPQQPLARIALKKHINDDTKRHYTLEPEERIYGNAPKEFLHRVRDIVDTEHNDLQPLGLYKKHERVYNDSGKSSKVNIGKNIEVALNSKNFDVRRAVFDKGDLKPEHIEKGLQDEHILIRSAAIRHKNAQSNHLFKALDDPHFSVVGDALAHPNIEDRHIDYLLRQRSGGNSLHSSVVRAVAESPKAQPQHLDAILDGEFGAAVGTEVARHPNVQPHHIEKILSDPKFFESSKYAAIEHPSASDEHLDNFFNNASNQLSHNIKAVLKNPKLKSHHLDKALMHHDRSVVENAISHPNVSAQHIDKVFDHQMNPNNTGYDYVFIKMKALQSPNVKSHHIDRALEDNDSVVRADAAKHPKAEIHHIERALNDPSTGVRLTVAKRPDLQPHQLDKLSNDTDWHVRSEVLTHPNIQPHHIDKALDDSDPRTQYFLSRAESINLQPHHISKLLKNPDRNIRSSIYRSPKFNKEHFDDAMNNPWGDVRRAVVKHQDASSQHLIKGLRDDDNFVRFDTVTNPNLQSHHIQIALQDSDSNVRSKAIQHPNVQAHHISKALDDEDILVRSNATFHPNTTSEHLHKALQDKSGNVRLAALHSKNTQPEHIERALSDHDPEIRSTAAEHPKAQAHHITKALHDENMEVRNSGYENKNLNADHLHIALKSPSNHRREWALDHPLINVSHLDQAIGDENEWVRTRALSHPLINVSHLDQAIGDKNEWVRRRALFHPLIQPHHIEKALSDPDPLVWKEAARIKEKMKSGKEMTEEVNMNNLNEAKRRWAEDYHDRAYRAGLKAKPENLEKATNALRDQLRKYNKKADFHQGISLGITQKYGVTKYSDIPDEHDRHRALHHQQMTDHYRHKESSAFWAHTGMSKALKQKGMVNEVAEIKGDGINDPMPMLLEKIKNKSRAERIRLLETTRLQLAKCENVLHAATEIEEQMFCEGRTASVHYARAEKQRALAERDFNIVSTLYSNLKKSLSTTERRNVLS